MQTNCTSVVERAHLFVHVCQHCLQVVFASWKERTGIKKMARMVKNRDSLIRKCKED